jgi:DNA (cytosine-5)-methyltransferase 1
VAQRLRLHADNLLKTDALPPRKSTTPGPILDNRLADWLIDTRIGALPNHESRGHMAG